MNAVEHFARALPAAAIRRLARLEIDRFAPPPPSLFAVAAARTSLDNDAALAHVIERWRDDLCAFLNVLVQSELVSLAATSGRSPALRQLLWDRGAALERGGAEDLAIQAQPVLLGGHLVVQAPPRGMFPPSPAWPREIPPPREPVILADEPDSIDELLAAADAALGVRLGARGTDKGAWGTRAQHLLGVTRDSGRDEPDWRGDVEIKTVPVAREPGGLWRVVEDPAIAMVGEGTAAKLMRTLWLARASLPEGDATLVSWYLLEADADVARLVRRFLHERPKGPRGTTARGHYLSKRFFAACGFLATLNGHDRR